MPEIAEMHGGTQQTTSGIVSLSQERRASARRAAGLFEPLVRLTAAGLLFIGAGFKAYSLYSGITVAEAWVTSPPLLFTLALSESMLALALLLGWRLRWVSFAAALAFLTFAVLNVFAGLEGRSSCGCFGTISVNPWPMAGIDLLMAMLLFASAASVDPGSASGSFRTGLRPAFVSISLVLFLTITAYGAIFFTGTNPETLLARLRGDLITVLPAEVELGSGNAGDNVETTVTLHNNAEQPIRIVGGSDDCSCITTENLPLQLEPGATATIRLKVRRTGSPGIQRRKYLLYTDHPQQPRVYAQLVGRVADKSSSQ